VWVHAKEGSNFYVTLALEVLIFPLAAGEDHANILATATSHLGKLQARDLALEDAAPVVHCFLESLSVRRHDETLVHSE
jgi:hypothetical protein